MQSFDSMRRSIADRPTVGHSIPCLSIFPELWGLNCKDKLTFLEPPSLALTFSVNYIVGVFELANS